MLQSFSSVANDAFFCYKEWIIKEAAALVEVSAEGLVDQAEEDSETITRLPTREAAEEEEEEGKRDVATMSKVVSR
jgi:hypothetical protein